MAVTSTTSTTPSTAGTGSSIISSLGSGSGIDTSALVNKLVDVNKYADSARLTTKKTLLETQISDFGLLRSSFLKLETGASTLGNTDTFNAKSVSVPTTTLLSVSKIDAKAAVGAYGINVDQIAQSQSLSSVGFSSQTAPIGKGTLAIRFGGWNAAVNTFTVDSTKTGGSIVIDDTNNSLTGLRDTINKSTLGLKASIVNNAGVYTLMVAAPSGATSALEITATETAGAPGLASFNFNQTTRSFTQLQDGRDALIRVNGMSIARPSNHITDVIDGLEFDLFNKSTTETVNVGITADKSIAEKAIRDLVAGYNTFIKDSGKLLGFDKDKNDFGSLYKDPTAKNLVQQVRNQLNAVVAGVSGNFNSLSSLGIRTEKDGTLTIDDSAAPTSFRVAIDKNFDAVRDLFVPKTSSNSAQITVTKFSNLSVPGTYDVVITKPPAKGQLIAGATVATFPFDTTGKTYSFTAVIDGTSAASITLPTKIYANGSDLAADLQSRINADTNLTAAKVNVNVVYNSTTKKL
jgi:flagellar hook-associated protein 2